MLRKVSTRKASAVWCHRNRGLDCRTSICLSGKTCQVANFGCLTSKYPLAGVIYSMGFIGDLGVFGDFGRAQAAAGGRWVVRQDGRLLLLRGDAFRVAGELGGAGFGVGSRAEEGAGVVEDDA